MATILVSFRLALDADYSDRRDSVIGRIRTHADRGRVWEEMTSLIVLQSPLSAEQIAQDVYLWSSFSPSRDTLFVVNTTNGTYATRGELEYPHTLANLFQANALGALLLG